MTLIILFHLYVEFMESNTLRHTDLIKPIKEYAESTLVAPSEVVLTLQAMYVRV